MSIIPYYDYTDDPDALISYQEQARTLTGESVNGALGGLPVAEQNQEYFVVFDEAGSTGPEIIDKTQFRITYLVDSNLQTSKPAIDTPAGYNTTQNFEKGKNCLVRADNATVLNQTLTGKQSIYDVGTLALISTTEYGRSKDEYVTTMSFDSVGGQLVGNAQNLTSKFSQTSGTNDISGANDTINVVYDIVTTPISGSDWIQFNDSTDYIFQQDTLVAETRLKFNVSFKLTITNVHVDIGVGNLNTSATIRIVYTPITGPTQILASFAQTVVASDYNPALNNGTWQSSMQTPYLNFNQGDVITVELEKGGTDDESDVILSRCSIQSIQETPPGEVLIIGLNATTSSYWSGFNNIGTIAEGNDYTILTASNGFDTFIGGDYIQRINTASAAFDPNNDGNTFNPIQTPLEFKIGDEIRFEYNQNKVHKVIDVEYEDNGTKISISPSVDTETLEVFGTQGTQLNHFTHYRIIPDGGYIIISQKKDNEAGVNQSFNGIITPQFTTEALREKGDELIYELKQAGIIET